MTELDFLLELLLEHKLPRVTKERVRARISTVSQQVPNAPRPTVMDHAPSAPRGNPATAQAPSTLAAMAKHHETFGTGLSVDAAYAVPEPVPEPEPVAVIAQTAATAAAMASRQQAIAASLAGVIDKANGRPRKF